MSDTHHESEAPAEHENQSHNTFAHALGILGFLISLVSVSWQIYLHYEAQTEKVAVNLQLIHRVEPGEDENASENKKGWLLFDLANTGDQPLYLKELLLTSCTLDAEEKGESCQRFYVYPTSFPNTDSMRLEPGASQSFWKEDWDFGKNPIRDLVKHPDAPEYYIRVSSTRGPIDHATVQVRNAYAHMDAKQQEKKKAH